MSSGNSTKTEDPHPKGRALHQPSVIGQIKLISNVIPVKLVLDHDRGAGIQWF